MSTDPTRPSTTGTEVKSAEEPGSILFVSRNMPIPGHAENDIIVQLACKLTQAGNPVTLAFPAERLPFPRRWLSGIRRAVAELPTAFTTHGLTVHVLRYVRLPGLHLSYLFAGWFQPPDLTPVPTWVHAHYVLPDGLMAASIAAQIGCPYGVSVRAGDLRKWRLMRSRSLLERRFRAVLDGAAIVYAPSPTIQQALSERGIDACLLPHGVDFPTDTTDTDRRAQQGVTVFSAATLLPLKHLDWLIDAIAALPENVTLSIAGSGPELSVLQSQVSTLGVSHRVRFLGRLSRTAVLAHMRKSHIYALPSVSETFGLSYLEAAAQGCAVLACRYTGVHGCFVEDKEMAFCEPSRKDVLARLAQLCGDPVWRARVAEGGQARVQRDYQWSSVITRYRNTVQEVLAC